MEDGMNRNRQIGMWSQAVMFLTLLAVASAAVAADHRGALTEEFHQTYALTAQGRVELDNINGPVHISTWDRDEVKVDAIKSAEVKKRREEAKMGVVWGKDSI